jgi:hypothetical protein
MARRVVVSFTDDLDGSHAEETVAFQLDGDHYEIDLSRANAQRLRELFAPYVAAGRGVTGPRASGVSAGGLSDTEARRRARQMRQWLADNGYTVKQRGRMPGELAQAYRSGTPASANTSIAPIFTAAT